MKKNYIQPKTEELKLCVEHSFLLFFSQVDNDGDGTTDQRPINEGDPDGGVGAKPGWFGEFDDEDDSW
ncbi:hypothetical protein [Segatella salivae]|uniref:hypothetical protein n=1 Tax=Segatella salivae TaxID=228604 RepID=UPI00248EC9F9|nr:hypothetical protein [Segatella salivae]